jgi:aspartate aminotransferase-like enzyme
LAKLFEKDIETDLNMLPGPISIHPRVKRAMDYSIIGHRTKPFKDFYDRTVDMFKEYLHTKYDLYILAGSGSAALEAGIVNWINGPNPSSTKILCFVNGKFSERNYKIAKKFGATTILVEIENGDPVTPELVEEHLKKNPGTNIATICHNETSTGVISPIKEIGEIVEKYDALLMTDGVTSVAGAYVCPEEQKIDILCSGSQKSWGLPPGLSLVCVSPRAWEKMPEKTNTLYFDLRAYKKNPNPYTPAISLVYGLHESLAIMLEETEAKRTERHAWNAELVRIGVKALGLKLFAQEGYESPVVTSLVVPEGIKDDIRKDLSELGVWIAPGQGEMKGQIFRIATMHMIREKDVLTTFALFEIVMHKHGYKFELGSSVKAIQEKILKK